MERLLARNCDFDISYTVTEIYSADNDESWEVTLWGKNQQTAFAEHISTGYGATLDEAIDAALAREGN